jgi:hypothetical protein
VGALLGRGAEQRVLAVREDFLERFELALGGTGAITTDLAQLARPRGERGVEPIVLALEQHRNLSHRIQVTDLSKTEHTRITSSARARGKIFLRLRDRKRRGRERDASDERTALEEQLQLAHRQLHASRIGVPPQTGEAAPLKALGVDA